MLPLTEIQAYPECHSRAKNGKGREGERRERGRRKKKRLSIYQGTGNQGNAGC